MIAGDKLYFVVNSDGDATDDETVWNPKITYLRISSQPVSEPITTIDDVNRAIRYIGSGWQHLGMPPSSVTHGIFAGSIGYLKDRYSGTLSVSGTSGDQLSVEFSGTGIRIIGSTGSDHGILVIDLDGEEVGRINTFVPERYLDYAKEPQNRIRKVTDVPVTPPVVLWSVTGLKAGKHLLTVTVTGEKSKESTGTFVGIDELVIHGKALGPPGPPKGGWHLM